MTMMTRRQSQRQRSPSIVFVRMQRTAPAPFNHPDADLILTTCAPTRFLVSRLTIVAASDYFRDRLASTPPSSAQNPAVIDGLPESDATMETILRLIYPVPEPLLCDLDDLSDAYNAATKYKMQKAQLTLERMLLAPRFLEAEPVRIYAIARRFGMVNIAETAAEYALRVSPVWPCYEEFNFIPARDYHTLATFHRERSLAAAACLDSSLFSAMLRPCEVCDEPKKRRNPLWWKQYVALCRPVLLETPVSTAVCDPSFVHKIVTSNTCKLCRGSTLEALFPGGAIHKLKQLLDDLPHTMHLE
ncbi:uncharacterized protein FIBRA_02309 [Fibroporia radiculosa]|uniref:BTB domain-containing protein n=1 Tax=Fibroporia radiculosa TaxID=599839 RepID=J4H1S4_9APHY|nr:uncharacterized protein FIBRA_02309 [Fibroporia radiculosa]CCM00279.1 predicted protein [Fibroporia radiculosa]